MKQIWFITGSQDLYGEETLRMVGADSEKMVAYMAERLPLELVWKPTVRNAREITSVMEQANADADCVGVITWMHTFSPSKMWIAGLSLLRKPVLHLHTQFNERLPYDTIDMDFMNLNQSAHGDREHGYIYARMRKPRKVVTGYWKDEQTLRRIAVWMQAALGYDECMHIKVCRFADNMREVAVTEGDKVGAQIDLGWSVDAYGVGDLIEEVNRVSDAEAEALAAEYHKKYTVVSANEAAITEQARYEIALERFLTRGGYTAFTTNFESLDGLKQLPGLAVQRLMEKGYGFGAEGDWKTAALTRVMKVMADNRATSFMEDYTLDYEKGDGKILGAHMLEVCPTVADGEIRIDVQPLGIGNRSDPARMIFDGMAGDAVAVSVIDMGGRFRLISADVEGLKLPAPMPKLPVARAMWRPLPDYRSGAKAWILAGGAHHSVLSFALTREHVEDLARMLNIECVRIGKDTDMGRYETDLQLSDFMWSSK